jgi:hypothetical protein
MTTKWSSFDLSCCQCGHTGRLIVFGPRGGPAFSLEGFRDDGIDLETIERSRFQCASCDASAVMCLLHAASQTATIEPPLPEACCLRPGAGQSFLPIEKCLTCRMRDLDLDT